MKKLRPLLYRFIFMAVIIIAAGLITGAFYDSSIISFTPRYAFAVFLGAAAGTATTYLVEYIARKTSAKKA